MKLTGTGLWVGWCSEKCVAYCLSMCSAMQRESALLCLGMSTFLEEGNSDIHQEPHWDHTDSQQRGHPGKEWKKSCKEGQGQHTLINFLSEESLTHPKVCQCYSLGEGIWYVGWNYPLIDRVCQLNTNLLMRLDSCGPQSQNYGRRSRTASWSPHRSGNGGVDGGTYFLSFGTLGC